MNKLYTYGCSFTQGMWEFDSTEEGEVEYRGIGCSKVVQYNSKDNWGKKLSKELNLEYVNRGYEGSGVLYALHCMSKDLGDYQEGDVVIIQMSYPERKYSHLNEFKNEHSHLRHTELIDRTPEWIGAERTWELESTLIRSLFKAFQKIGVRFYYWTTVDLPPQYNLEEFSTSKLIFDDFQNYTLWIQDKKELYYDYDMRGKGAEDIHQNEAGHLVQSLIFKRQIK